MANNSNLHSAKVAKNDEFYTQLSDIEQELKNYKGKFKNKIVFCNCDAPVFFKNGKMDCKKTSKFIVHFVTSFEDLGLKKLICLGYRKGEKATAYIYNGDLNNNGFADEEEWEKIPLNGDGDFRSEESVNFLKQSDIVVTNPPFSLFREYVAKIMEYGKKFLAIGNMNSITYKGVFPLIKDNKVWLGYGFNNGNAYFIIPKTANTNYASGVYNSETNMVKFGNACWFTNLDHEKRHDRLLKDNTCTYKGNETLYPKYDNYDAIEVSKLKYIPGDYMGVMGVPITFLNKYNPDEFEIVGITSSSRECAGNCIIGNATTRAIVNGRYIYARILIRRK